MAKNHFKLYAKINKKTGEYEFVGTMKELADHLDMDATTIRTYMWRCAKLGRACPYVLVGEKYTEEEKLERKREYAREHGKEAYQKKKEKMIKELLN